MCLSALAAAFARARMLHTRWRARARARNARRDHRNKLRELETSYKKGHVGKHFKRLFRNVHKPGIYKVV